MSKKKKKEKEEEPKKVEKAKAPARKKPVDPLAVKPKKAPAVKKKPALKISDEDIALRAYYIAEHRQRLGLHGTEHGDWVEAERQLREEASR